ncbi:MAG: hypothetical protein ABSE42_21790 [Bryobacteraceae bacterium]|jgi:hypothetical protein
MPAENAVVAVCNGAADAKTAMLELRQEGLAADCISVVAVDEQSGFLPVAYYFDGGRLRGTAARGSSQSLLETLPDCAVLVSPGERTILLAGPFAACIVRTLANEGLFGDLGPIAAGLYSLGIPRDAARDYELSALRGRPLVIVHGRARDIERARHILAARIEGQEQPIL